MKNEEVKCPEYGIVMREEEAGSGRYYADFLPEYNKPELVVPEEVNGMKIVGLKCLNVPDSAVRKIRLSRLVESIQFGLRRFGGRYLEVEIDEGNPYYKSDGKAIYSRNGELIIFYAGGCKSYEVLPGTRVIGEGAFWDAPNLRHIKLPQGIEEIRIRAFFKLTALRDINIPDTVRFLGKKAFFGCRRLETLHVPHSVEAIGEQAFPVSGAFREITVDVNNLHYTAENGVLYSKDKTRLVFAPSGAAGKSFTVPDFVTAIGYRAFNNHSELEEVILPPGVVEIDRFAFGLCSRLRSINLDNVKRIGDYAFDGCNGLSSIELFCEELGESAFRKCYHIKTAVLHGLKSSGCAPFSEALRELVLFEDFDCSVFSRILSNYQKSPSVIAVRDHTTGELLYKLSGNFDNAAQAINVIENFREDSFDFENYDRANERLLAQRYIYEMTKLYAAYLRLKYPRELSERAREFYRGVLSELAEYAFELAVDSQKYDALPEFFEVGMINESNIIALIDLAVGLNATEFTAILLELKNRYFPNISNNFDLE